MGLKRRWWEISNREIYCQAFPLNTSHATKRRSKSGSKMTLIVKGNSFFSP
jgi:hypothetical protein